ncbi:PD-(D/E)XK nuclease domain-containing protein [Fusobacterium mortiferum]|uniref:PD-(D/E)XK nuclease domain-containing protein n=3 Tax=Fusobacterium TaxID=848 RepID=A0ABS2G625_FUSMR|nr:PD-(D/E)XK nuclease domain-containing protein [Fusobacterium mortiferum]
MDKSKNGLVIEFKVARSKEELLSSSEEALKQIEEKNYTRELKMRGIKRVVLVGISFYQREFEVVGKVIED